MLNTLQLAEQLQMQNRLNRLVNPQWVTAGYPWPRAIMVEGVELLDHLGWKWKATPEATLERTVQAHLELVDIWHFILAWNIQYAHDDLYIAAANIRLTLREPNYQVRLSANSETLDLRDMGAREALHVLIGCAAFGDIHLTAFVRVMECLSLSWERLNELYVQKNVLNIFRQEHGYKTGEYIKIWAGREDNEVLAQLMRDNPAATPSELMKMLEEQYTLLK